MVNDTDIFSMQLIDVWHYILTCSLCSVVQCVILHVSNSDLAFITNGGNKKTAGY